jgi:ATP phosphoribosyltransferase
VLETEATLIRSTSLKHPDHAALMEKITSRMAGVVASERYVICQYNIERSKLPVATAITPGRRAATISPLDNDQWVAVSAMVEKKKMADIMDQLVAVGASDVLVLRLQNCRV